MSKIVGLPDISFEALEAEVKNGARFVCYQYCVSILVMTYSRGTDVYYIPPGKSAVAKGLGWTALSFVVGWWGIPWGLIRTPMALATNLSGGKNLTHEVMAHYRSQFQVHVPNGSADEIVWGNQQAG
ncbi:MAG: hypothetical protein ABMA14_18300 [Hyphomonadaceae bacterium]